MSQRLSSAAAKDCCRLPISRIATPFSPAVVSNAWAEEKEAKDQVRKALARMADFHKDFL